MEDSNTIQTELQGLSALLAGLDKENLYALPQGYFEDLPEILLRQVKVLHHLNNDLDSSGSFANVPPGYFEQLAGNILDKIKAQSGDNIIIETPEISANLIALRNKTTYTLPSGYFEGFTISIANSIEELHYNAVEETSSISVLLGGVERKNLYSVPRGYFDNLAQQIHAKVSPAAKVVTVSALQRFFKYAAAAIFISAISIGVIKYSNQEKGGNTAKLESSIQNGIKMDDKKFDETLNTLSQDDILQYLEKNSTDDDIAVLTSDMEEGNLPAQDDYLTDDKTLDKFIETINTKN